MAILVKRCLKYSYDREIDNHVVEMQKVLGKLGIRHPTKQLALKTIVLQNQTIAFKYYNMKRKPKTKKEVVFT